MYAFVLILFSVHVEHACYYYLLGKNLAGLKRSDEAKEAFRVFKFSPKKKQTKTNRPIRSHWRYKCKQSYTPEL